MFNASGVLIPFAENAPEWWSFLEPYFSLWLLPSTHSTVFDFEMGLLSPSEISCSSSNGLNVASVRLGLKGDLITSTLSSTFDLVSFRLGRQSITPGSVCALTSLITIDSCFFLIRLLCQADCSMFYVMQDYFFQMLLSCEANKNQSLITS